ncbi:hypothetical protein FHS85_004994 [Rhodoligotrophos appendicifer]|uniref:hypothetical protein n=1 Tax=Rhodoligotrophos appendicifer TaxID=987056 RepID=UPI001184BF70|nr:hypothetical protein [Rhodoligotrophos appendicifer]
MTERENPCFEPRDMPARGVVYALGGLFAGIGLAIALVGGLSTVLTPGDRSPSTRLERQRIVPPPPRLQTDPQADLVRQGTMQAKQLERYGWTDRLAGRARIPIERAMDLLAESGWPDFDRNRP